MFIIRLEKMIKKIQNNILSKVKYIKIFPAEHISSQTQ